jgi:membrane protease YdiL (CAAX protease family)
MKSMQGMTTEWEFLQPKPYRNLGEGSIALLGIVIWFIAILVRHRLPEAGDWTLSESLMEAFSFVVFAGVPVFGLAIQWGDRLTTHLLPNQGLRFQIALCTALSIFIGMGKGLNLSDRHFDWIDQFKILMIPGQFWLNVALFLGGVFVALRIPFVVQALRQKPLPHLRWQLYGLLLLNALYLSLHRTASPWEGFAISLVYGAICIGLTWPHRRAVNASPRKGLVPSDFGLMVLCVAILYWFSIPSFSFGVFVGVDLFILVMIYGSGLGREHFGYSFASRPKDWPVLGALIFAVLVVLVPLAIASGFVRPALVQSQFSPLKLAVYFVLFTFRVAIFEEVFFRSGVMVLLRDCLSSKNDQSLCNSPPRIGGLGGLMQSFTTPNTAINVMQRLHIKRSPQTILWISALGCSVLFGLSHIGNAPGANTLSLWQYRGIYMVLATFASILYSIAFAKTNRLAIPILIHGFVDTTAVVLLGGSLAVPF